MALKFALLGMIALRPASGYDLKRMIDRSIYFIWNVTGPQIYSTLRTLREDGHISSESVPQKGKPDKHIHTITAKGRTALQDFMNEPIRASVTRDEVLLRIFFGNFASEKVIMRELGSYLDRIRHERAYMEATKARIEAHPGPKHEARRFQLLSLRLKVAQYRVMEQELAKFCKIDLSKRAPAAAVEGARGAVEKEQGKPRLALVYPSEQPSAPAAKRRRRT
jgi:DNA-binding PadR family transcriptional regulator